MNSNNLCILNSHFKPCANGFSLRCEIAFNLIIKFLAFGVACAGVDNWSRVHTKLVALCPDFSKDSEACRKKWSAIYNDYKEDKAMNLKSGSGRSEKCRWYDLVDEFMHDRANVVAHAHASTNSPDGPKCKTTLETNTIEQRSDESTSKSSEPKRKDDILHRECIGEIRESNKTLMENMKASDDMKMSLLMTIQQTMQKMIKKM